MKISYFLAIVVALTTLTFTSCSNENVQDEPQAPVTKRHHVTLNAGSAGSGVRAVFATNLLSNSPFYWQKNDQIGVLTSEAETFSPLALESRSTNLESATFSGEIEGDLGEYAVYPYNEGHKVSGTTLTYHLPSTYTYNKWDTDFVANADKVDDNNVSAVPALYAKIAAAAGDEASAEFKHLAGLLCIKIDQMPASNCFLKVTADRQICGDFEVNLASSQPEIESDADEQTDVADELKTVTITANGTSGSSAVFYIPMPVGDDYKVKVSLGSYTIKNLEMSSTTSAKNLGEVERGKITIASLTQSKMHKGGSKVVQGHRFVDLGLSKMWADCNLEAATPADYGRLYAWAETASKDYFAWSTYKYYNEISASTAKGECTNYQSKEATLEAADDVAYQLWGSYCRMPTKDEMNELVNGTTQKEASYQNAEGKMISGLEFTSKTNGNSIFMPYVGSSEGDQGWKARYWTSTSGVSYTDNGTIFGITYSWSYDYAYMLQFTSSSQSVEERCRADGLAVRPVLQ